MATEKKATKTRLEKLDDLRKKRSALLIKGEHKEAQKVFLEMKKLAKSKK